MVTTGKTIINGVDLHYERRGEGDPVVFIHAGAWADWFRTLIDEGSLAARYALLSYHRAGYGRSGRKIGNLSIADNAAHAHVMMRHVGIERAHIVGYSTGGSIALQLALDFPHAVHSISLLEPTLPSGPDAAQRARTLVEPALERYRQGDKAGALLVFMKWLSPIPFDEALEKSVPGAFSQAVADADTFFEQELPAVNAWSFERDDAMHIAQPVLAVLGERSDELSPMFGKRQALLLDWLPNAEPFVLPGATHLLQVENPCAMAEGLMDFFDRHPC